MRILFVKLPSDKKVARIGYNMDEFLNKNFQSDGFELLFEDNDGYCYMSPFSADDLGRADNILEIEKLFNLKVDYISDVLVAYFQDTIKGAFLEGWYKHAEVYKYYQSNSVSGKYYNIRCKSQDAVYLHEKNRIASQIEFDNYLAPSKKDAESILQFIDSYHGPKANIIFEESLSAVNVFKHKNMETLIENCKQKIEDKASTPNNYFEVAAMCENALITGLKCSKIFEILVYVYLELRQFEKTVFYSRHAFESKPNEVNKFFYAAHLEYTPEWEKAIPLYQELVKSKALAYSKEWETVIPESRKENSKKDLTDYARFNLARLLKIKGHLKLAYDLFNEVSDPDYKQPAQELMQAIDAELPNLAKEKSYRIGGQIISLEEQYAYLPIDQMPLPDIQTLHNKEYFLDPIRRKPVQMTPEETVRQKTIRYLIDKLKVPESLILVEESLNHKDKSLKDRIDILVKTLSSGIYKDLLIVECKEPNVVLNGEAIEQILRYNRYCEAKYLLLTNGVFSLIYRYAGDNKYLPCEELPEYKNMVGADWKDLDEIDFHEWHRPERKKLELQEYRDNGEYWGIIGVDTPKDIAVLTLNLHYCLVDASEKLIYDKKGLYFNKLRDIGLTSRTIGDPSGGKFYLDSRWFEIQSTKDQTINIYIAVGAVGKTDNDPVFGNRKGTSNVIVSIEHKGNAVPILELCLDRYARKRGASYVIEHDGRRSHRTNQSTIDYVSASCPDMLENGNVYLGTLDNSKSFSFSKQEERDFFDRLISYTLLRYELWNQDRN